MDRIRMLGFGGVIGVAEASRSLRHAYPDYKRELRRSPGGRTANQRWALRQRAMLFRRGLRRARVWRNALLISGLTLVMQVILFRSAWGIAVAAVTFLASLLTGAWPESACPDWN